MITTHALGFRRILVCLDRSERAEGALPLAATLGRAENASLTLVHVLESSGRLDHGRGADLLDLQIRRAEARAYLERLVASIDVRDTRARSLIVDGSAPERIEQMVSPGAGALLVLATRGDGAAPGAGDRGVGSTARAILARARCAVLTVPLPCDSLGLGTAPRRILVPLDGSARSARVLPTVVRLARALSAEVVLAALAPQAALAEIASRYEDARIGSDRTARLARQAVAHLDRVRSQLETSGVRATRVRGSIGDGEELVACARTEGADLTAMSAQAPDRRPGQRLGASAAHFMERSDCPLLLLEDLEAAPGRTARWSTVRRASRTYDVVAGEA